MPLKDPQNHSLIWTDLLKDLATTSSWWQVVVFLYNKKHGYSNNSKCLKRDHSRVRADAFEDERVRRHLASGESMRKKIDIVLDEMCHQLDSQGAPSRRLKFGGTFFIKCITKVYSSIYVNNHLFPLRNGFKLEENTFKEEYLGISRALPMVILPTHRSYMDFLFISYIMTHYELPLPIVATGDNFKALGKTVTNYLKSTGAFLVRRNAQGKKDVDASVYYDTLRAYVHSILRGGEHPMEFFMEGTRTRVGQVLRPKTGLLSMVVDAILDDVMEDVYILPVAINYQRPIEEQLFIAENTPEINRNKPKENTRNLINAFEAIMKRKYGKVYVRFLEPFRVRHYFNEWKLASKIGKIDESNRNESLHQFTNSLASKICLAQATNNILMPFNLLTCSILSRSFLETSTYSKAEHQNLRVSLENIVDDFYQLETLLKTTQAQFLPGWESRLEIIEEFELDRDGIVRASIDRRHVEFKNDALTFQTMLYYSNQLVQILLPVAICLVVKNRNDDKWEEYKKIRTLLSREFFANEVFIKQEFDETVGVIQDSIIPPRVKQIISSHLRYFFACYLRFLHYLQSHDIFDRNEFFQTFNGRKPDDSLFISKDMLKNMTSMVKDEAVCDPLSDSIQLRVVDGQKLTTMIEQYEQALSAIDQLQ